MTGFRLLLSGFFLVSNLSLALGTVETTTFDVQGMNCATCPIVVRKAMQRVDGVKSVRVSLQDKSAVVTFDPSVTTPAKIGQASTDVGFPTTVRGSR